MRARKGDPVPWIKNGKEEKCVAPTIPEFEVLGKDLPPSVRNDPKIQEQWQRERQASDTNMRRIVVEWCELYAVCPRKPCRRNGKCTSPTVACHDEAIDWLKEHFYKPFKELRKGGEG
jgi:hypothetical protein